MRSCPSARCGPPAALFTALFLACGGAPGDESAPIAELDGRTISLAEFQPVLERHASDGVSSDAVKSRLLDQFLDDQVLLQEAIRRGIQVDDQEVERMVAGSGREAATGYRDEVRATLRVQRLLRLILAEASSITSQEEEEYYQQHAEQFHASARVAVRQILLDDAAVAAEVHGMVIQEPERFAKIAAERSTSPDRGGSLTYAFDALPTEISAVLEGMKEGTISPVIETKGRHWIFLVEAVHEERNLTLDEARPEIRNRLREEKGNGAMAQLLVSLKGKLGLQVHEENLPFRYVEEEPA